MKFRLKRPKLDPEEHVRRISAAVDQFFAERGITREPGEGTDAFVCRAIGITPEQFETFHDLVLKLGAVTQQRP